MIRIRRTSYPSCLSKPDHEFVQNDYKKDEVISALSNMQHGKCCYCERSLYNLASTEREVEHYQPKSACKDHGGNIQWHIANKWDNLLYACRACNSRKGSQHPFDITTGQRLIIDPTNEDIDPEDHIDFQIDDHIIIFIEKEGSSLGRSTIDKLGLIERTDLLGQFRRIKAHIDLTLFELVNAVVDNNTININSKKEELSRATGAQLEFAAFHRKCIAKRIEEINAKKHKFEAVYGKPFSEIEISIHKGYETAT